LISFFEKNMVDSSFVLFVKLADQAAFASRAAPRVNTK